MRRETPFKMLMVVLIGFLICLFVIAIFAIQPDHIEGQVIEKYIDSSDQDIFKFVIQDPEGEYWVARVSPEDYYSHEVGDWFDGDVEYADDLDSWWW